MEDTQSYLNDILKKRLGSVPNYGSATRTANNVTRMPKKQEKIESMPTVFRKKHQTVFTQGQTQYSQAQSQFLSMKSGSISNRSKNGFINQQQQQVPEQKQTSNQRVEYMLISKRIQSKKQDQYTAPVVDVTKYSQLKQPETKSTISSNELKSGQRVTNRHSQMSAEEEDYGSRLQSEGSMDTVMKSKRKKIFQK